MTSRYQELKELESKFLGVFNAADVDGIMDFFTEDAVYGEVHGKTRGDLGAIRKSFDGLFNGQFGEVRFEPVDTMVDEKGNKVMSSWKLHLTLDGKQVALEGLDLLYFRGDKIYKKLTYGKAKTPLYLAASIIFDPERSHTTVASDRLHRGGAPWSWRFWCLAESIGADMHECDTAVIDRGQNFCDRSDDLPACAISGYLTPLVKTSAATPKLSPR